MAKNSKRTTKQLASTAAKFLSDANSSKIKKHLSGSVLAQSRTTKQTGKKMESELSAILKSSKYDKDTKMLAASLLSQSNSSR
ncbi:conserved hypothetical protein [Shewanella halifaxensis HAW-EB4]|uniref:Uncharacterized protein n=1 Tax=Shewanella halifaxensis (strain HAW-EB4) TaxID=458817 RepID=B0TPN0_SHEHH|nr:hypothetical protein [Shewanella halifaxensis]ABZ74901.1 conserved hypothetical protein [Shewanella halifaxensis HAW-EB4]